MNFDPIKLNRRENILFRKYLGTKKPAQGLQGRRDMVPHFSLNVNLLFSSKALLRLPNPTRGGGYQFKFHTVCVKSMSPVDIELFSLFVILYNITALHHNTNIFLLKSSNLNK